MRRVIVCGLTVCLVALTFSTMAFAQRGSRNRTSVDNTFRNQRTTHSSQYRHHQRFAPNRHTYRNNYQYHRNFAPNRHAYRNHYRHHNRFAPYRHAYRHPYGYQHRFTPNRHAYGIHRTMPSWGRQGNYGARGPRAGWQGGTVPPGWSNGNRSGWQGHANPPSWINSRGQRTGWRDNTSPPGFTRPQAEPDSDQEASAL